MALLHYINTLSELTGAEIDLSVLNQASAFMRHQYFQTGVPLLIKDPAHIPEVPGRKQSRITRNSNTYPGCRLIIDNKLIERKIRKIGAVPPQDLKVFAQVIRSFMQSKIKSNSVE